jgi:hypothetical protein
LHWYIDINNLPENIISNLGAWLESKGHFEQWRWNSIKDDVTHWAELPEPPCV